MIRDLISRNIPRCLWYSCLIFFVVRKELASGVTCLILVTVIPHFDPFLFLGSWCLEWSDANIHSVFGCRWHKASFIGISSGVNCITQLGFSFNSLILYLTCIQTYTLSISSLQVITLIKLGSICFGFVDEELTFGHRSIHCCILCLRILCDVGNIVIQISMGRLN